MSDQIPLCSVPQILRHVKPFASLASLLVVVLFGGCGGAPGPQHVSVNGMVSIDNIPLKSGLIRFIPTGGTQGPAAVAIVEDGFYEMRSDNGPVVGQHRVEIEATNHLGFDLDDEQAYASRVAQGHQMGKNPVPLDFNRQSKLVVELPGEGRSDLDFRLKSSNVLADSR